MAKIEKLSIALTNYQAEALRQAVEDGDYASVSEAARRAVTEWLERRDQQRAAAIERVRELINEGIASGIAPKRRTAKEISADGRRRLALLKQLTKIG